MNEHENHEHQHSQNDKNKQNGGKNYKSIKPQKGEIIEGNDTCPVCNMNIESTKFYSEYNGKTFYFCSDGCLQKSTNSPSNFFDNHNFDLIIIGGGPAGLTAAVYASISRIDTFFIANDIGGQAIDSTKIKNYMGFDFISGKMGRLSLMLIAAQVLKGFSLVVM